MSIEHCETDGSGPGFNQPGSVTLHTTKMGGNNDEEDHGFEDLCQTCFFQEERIMLGERQGTFSIISVQCFFDNWRRIELKTVFLQISPTKLCCGRWRIKDMRL
jgi:hypothetical protein